MTTDSLLRENWIQSRSAKITIFQIEKFGALQLFHKSGIRRIVENNLKFWKISIGVNAFNVSKSTLRTNYLEKNEYQPKIPSIQRRKEKMHCFFWFSPTLLWSNQGFLIFHLQQLFDQARLAETRGFKKWYFVLRFFSIYVLRNTYFMTSLIYWRHAFRFLSLSKKKKNG